MDIKEAYLGDGLYASFDGYQFILRAPREDGDHWVALDPIVLETFLEFVEAVRQNKKPTRSFIVGDIIKE